MILKRGKRSPRSSHSGMTLLEMLIYVGIAAFVLMAVLALLVLLSQSWLKGRARASVEENVRIAVERMRSETEAAQKVLSPVSEGDNLELDVGSGSANYSGYAWSEHLGWISMGCENQPDPWDCDQVNNAFDNYGVKHQLDTLSGFAMTENTGFISFNCVSSPNADPCKTGDYRITVDALGEYHGWAWGEQLGWISFNCADRNVCGTSNYKVYESKIATGAELRGWAWSENYGWISFDCLDTDDPTPCSPVDYGVTAGLAGTRTRFSLISGVWTIATGNNAPQNLTDPATVAIAKCSGEPWYFKVIANPAPARPAVQVCFDASYRGTASALAPYSTTARITFQLR